MPSNYARGASFERHVQRYLEEKGWTVVRAAGSHSPVDLVAIREKVWLIQCRTNGDLFPFQWNELLGLGEESDTACVLCFRPTRGAIEFRRLVNPKEPGKRTRNLNLSVEVFPE